MPRCAARPNPEGVTEHRQVVKVRSTETPVYGVVIKSEPRRGGICADFAKRLMVIVYWLMVIVLAVRATPSGFVVTPFAIAGVSPLRGSTACL